MQYEGRNVVIELLRSKQPMQKILLTKGINADPKIKEIIKLARKQKITIEFKPHTTLDRISKTQNHQGVIAHGELRKDKLSEILRNNSASTGGSKKLIYIREALLEGNIGAVARSAEVAGFSAVIVPPKVNLTAQTFRASAGALANIPIIKDSLFGVIKQVHDQGFRVVGIEVVGENYYYEEDLTGDILFIVGGEDRSLSPEILEKCDLVVKIPSFGRINSLNLSVAASVVMFDSIRQEALRNTKSK